MEQVHNESSEEQYVGAKFIEQCLDVGRTKSYQIVKEIEGTCPGNLIRLGRCLRWPKDFLFPCIYEHGVRLGGARDRA
jgi:hypothetical protein